jgi:hypothetical protein
MRSPLAPMVSCSSAQVQIKQSRFGISRLLRGSLQPIIYKRSNCARLVCILIAISVLVIFFSFISSASLQASTRLMAIPLWLSRERRSIVKEAVLRNPGEWQYSRTGTASLTLPVPLGLGILGSSSNPKKPFFELCPFSMLVPLFTWLIGFLFFILTALLRL